MYSTGVVIDVDLWLKKKERAKVVPAKEKELNELNIYLDKLNQCVIDFMTSKHSSKTILREDLKSKLEGLKVDEQKEQLIKQQEDLELEKQKLENENNFYSTWERIINTTKTKDGLPISEATKSSKHQTLNLVKEHCAKNKSD